MLIKFYPAISHIIKSNQHLDLEKIRVPVYISFGPICFAILFKLNKPEKPKTLDNIYASWNRDVPGWNNRFKSDLGFLL